MLALCAPKAEKVIRGWMSANRITILEDEISLVRDILIQTAHVRRSATKEDFTEAIRANGLDLDDHRISYHIRLAELAGILCSGDLLATFFHQEDRTPNNHLAWQQYQQAGR